MDLSNKNYTNEELQEVERLLEQPEDGIYTPEYEHEIRRAFDIFTHKGVPISLLNDLVFDFTMYCLEYELEEYEHLWENAVEIDNQYGYVSKIPDNISKLQNIETLNLGFNFINYISPEIGNLTSLRTLILASNQITSLPKEISNLRNIQEINVSTNPLKALPSDFANLENLEYLSVNNMSINLVNIYPEVFQLKKLKTLVMGQNQLTSISSEIGMLVELEELFLARNPIKILPNELYQLPNIHTLHLQETQITSEEINKLKQVFGDKVYLG